MSNAGTTKLLELRPLKLVVDWAEVGNNYRLDLDCGHSTLRQALPRRARCDVCPADLPAAVAL